MKPENRQRWAVRLLMGTLGSALVALAGYLSYRQVFLADEMAARAYDQQHMRVPIRPVRGSILDTRMRVLAGSIDVQSVFADPHVIVDPSAAATKVGRVLSMDPGEIVAKLTEERLKDPPGRFLWLRRRVSPETAEAVRRLNLPGITTITEGSRHYPNGSLAAHILGCVGIDEQGLDGLEMVFNERLCGAPGEARVLADRSRRPIWTEPEHFRPAVDGQQLVLTIDATIQAAAEEAIAEACTKFRARSATAIVIEPATGYILAMANVPTFNPNQYARFPVEARRNRAVTDTFPPGSSCKPFIAAAALEAGVVHFGDIIFCENGFWAEHKLHDAGHSYGNLTFERVLEKSSNIGMAKLGLRLGNERLHECLQAFGFGRRSGVWLPGESSGVVFSLPRWTRLSTTRVAFGQEFAVTPLQLTSAFAAIANHGKLMRPKILRGVLDSRGQKAADLSETEVVGQAVGARTAHDLIQRALVGVIQEGTGTACRIPGYKVFGKTGTAQKIDPGTRTVSHSRFVGTFLCGAPADNPRVVVMVMVDEPDRSLGYYGGTVAAPAAKRILEQTLPYLGIPPTEPIPEQNGTRLVQQRVTN